MTATLTREQLAAMLDEEEVYLDLIDKFIEGDSDSVSTEPETQPELPTPTPPTEQAKRLKRDECLYIDLETIPDERRMHLFDLPPIGQAPPVTPDDELLSSTEFLSQGIAEAGSWLAKKNPPFDWYQTVESEEKAGKNRKGMLQALEDRRKQIDSLDNEKSERIKLLSVTPLYCRIAAIGWAIGDEPPQSIVIENPDNEIPALNRLWSLIANSKPLVGFNIIHFDVPVILTRSMILRVNPTCYLDRRKYGSSDIVDLATELYGPVIPKGFGAKRTAKLLGINVPADGMDGSHVYRLAQEGKWAEIGAYVRSDVALNQEIHRRKMAGYFCT